MSSRDPVMTPYIIEITREGEAHGQQYFETVARIKIEATEYEVADAIGSALTAGFPREKGIRYHTNASEDESI